MYTLILSVLTVYLVQTSESSKILAVFPAPSISHQVAFRPLTQALVQRGHEVIVITPDPVFPKGQAPANLTEIDVHDILYSLWRSHFMKSTTGKSSDMFTQAKLIMELIIMIFEELLKSKEVQQIIHDKTLKFDLIITEQCVRPALVFSHIFNAPLIMISSGMGFFSSDYNMMGAPTHPFLYPSTMQQKLYNLTLWEKLTELYKHVFLEYIFINNKKLETESIRNYFGQDTPSIDELYENVDMLFLNVHPIWEMNRPVPPGIIYMGAIHVKQEKELPKEIKTYLDSSKNGVIYISYGTNVLPSMLPPKKIQTLVNVLSQLPYDILWKWDKDELPGRTPNIRISKWLPQSDLLRHPKIKLFITQGGLQSTDEAIAAGVPLIGMPMLGDQWYNVENYVHLGIGLRLDLETTTEETFRNAINTIIDNKSYRRNIAKLRDIMYDQPQRPLERAVWWAEHVLRHGGARHLRAPAANMPWTQYYEVELVVIVLVGFITISLLFSFLIYGALKMFLSFISPVKLKTS